MWNQSSVALKVWEKFNPDNKKGEGQNPVIMSLLHVLSQEENSIEENLTESTEITDPDAIMVENLSDLNPQERAWLFATIKKNKE